MKLVFDSQNVCKLLVTTPLDKTIYPQLSRVPGSGVAPPASQPAGQQPATKLPSRQPAFKPGASQSVHCPASNPLKSTKSIGFHRFSRCQPDGLESVFSQPEASKLTPNGLNIKPRTLQGLQKWSLKAPKVATEPPKTSQRPPM